MHESSFVAYNIAVMTVVSADCRYHIATVKLLSPILITGRVCAMCLSTALHTALNSGAECVCEWQDKAISVFSVV